MHTPGRTLGRYELIARIGEGGMAEVHLARQRGPRAFEKLVVVKTVHPRLTSRPAVAEALLDEARIAAKVKHPHVVDIYDLGEEDGTYFIAMEYLEGESMTAIIRAQRAAGGARLPPLRTARIIADCAAGLHAAHELRSLSGEPLELVHQDVTPGNVIVLYTGQSKLVDFGVAKVRTSSDAGLVKGKAGYLAPELFERRAADRRSDVFALGVVLWESLTLRRLFHGATEAETFAKVKACQVPAPSSLVLGVPPELDRLCARALCPSPEERYPTAKAMQDDLNKLLRGTDKGDYEPIAQFMRTTFAPQIAARQQLFRELDKGGVPDATAIEALTVRLGEGSTPRSVSEGGGGSGEDEASAAGSDPGSRARAGSVSGSGSVSDSWSMSDSGSGSGSVSGSDSDSGSDSGTATGSDSGTATGSVSVTGTATATASDADEVEALSASEIDMLDEPGARSRSVQISIVEQADASPAAPRPTTGSDVPSTSTGDDDELPAPRSRRFLYAGGAAALFLGGLTAILLVGSGSRTDRSAGSVATRDRGAAPSDPTAPDPQPGAATDPIAAPPIPETADLAPPSVPPPSTAPPSVAPPSTAPPSTAPPSVAPPSTAPPSTAPPVTPTTSPVKAALTAKPAPAQVKTTPVSATPDAPPPRDRARAESFAQEGLKRFARGDTRGAIDSFQAALREDRGYAPAHRGLGLAYEKAGDRSRAVRSFRTYLDLAPNARDASQIRTRMEKL